MINGSFADHFPEARIGSQAELLSKYSHEAAEHRRILFARGSGMHSAWRSFRQFLADMGPAPGSEFLATRLAASDLTYSPGKVAWIHRDRQPTLVDRWQSLEARSPSSSGQWVQVRDKHVEYTTLANHLGVPFSAMAVALKSGQSPDELVQQASIGESLSSCAVSWMPPDRRDTFLMGFRMWHMQVLPAYAAAATPAFLYLYSALPSLMKSRNELMAQNLWEPATQNGMSERSGHPSWRRFCETMMRVEAARNEFAIYRQYSLMNELDELWHRVSQAEARFRGATVKSGAAKN